MDDASEIPTRLRLELRHRMRPLVGRDPAERDRAVTPLELLYDLTYVVAFAAAADLLAEHLAEGEVWSAIAGFVFVGWAVSWAWLNFTWFASAYGNDDVMFRLATIVQMIGVVVLVFGLPAAFEALAHAENPLVPAIVIGYVVMRVPQIALWLAAARQDPAHRRIALAYAVIISAAQVGWVLLAIAELPIVPTIVILLVLASAEMAAPVMSAHRMGFAPWNAGHIAERFALLTLITIGEVIAGTTAAVGALTLEQGWSPEAVLIISSGLLIAAAIWWTYFLVPSRTVLELRPTRTFSWRYAHLPLFASIAAVGAGLHLTTIAVEHGGVSLFGISLALAIPLALTIVVILLIWSVLLRSFDLSHLSLLLVTLAPLVAAVVVGFLAGPTEPIDLEDRSDLTALSVVISLVALGAVIEVVGHELVGYGHTLRAWQRTAGEAEGATATDLPRG
ncbi:low temperature requirement protein A [Agromyces sp. MMS24-K17]|uniref:low temperature requirement protein A n=1 Tax=Agromyces sp. MMS24-K17 TaxID=3372850 RepID=UPI003753F436